QVCLGVVVGREVRLIALSGSPSVKKNSPSTLATQHAMAECLDQKQIVAFPPLKARDSAAGNRLHQNLAKATGQPALCSIPVRVGESVVGIVMLRRHTGD